MLLHALSNYVGQAFVVNGVEAAYGRVQKADRPDLADVQCNGALQAAKLLGKKPRDIAEAVVAHIQADAQSKQMFAKIDIAGPGFINFSLTPHFLAQQVAAQTTHVQFGFALPKPETVVIDFCGPNVAKTMHIGHIRSTIIGDALQRIHRYAGHNVISDVHLGDWGLQIGMLIYAIRERQPDLPYFKEGYNGGQLQEAPFTFDDLCVIYPQAAALAKSDPEIRRQMRLITADAQAGHAGYNALWQHVIDMSEHDIKQKTDALDVHFTYWYGERHTAPILPHMLDELRNKGLAVPDEGATVMHVAEESDTREMPPLILEKSDGGVLYGATDLATIIQRVKDFNPDRILYVVDQRQGLHFEQVFRAAAKAGYIAREKCIHIGYGTMNGKDGKPFKTRDGGVLDLGSLLQMLEEKASERLHEIGLDQKLSSDELAASARGIGYAAAKFADLSNPPKSDYVFDLDKFVAFEGKTGPYVQYTVVRVNALIAKATQAGLQTGAIIVDEAQKDTALLLLEFPDAIEGVLRDYAPNVLCDYLFRLAQSVNRFYQTTPVIIEENVEKRGAALALLQHAATILTKGLDLLGIKLPAQM